MTRNKYLTAILLLLCVTLFCGCSNNALDGDWPAIQLTINGKVHKSHTYNVPVEGGEYKIYSKNYGSLWLIGVMEDDERVWPTESSYDYRTIHLTNDWYELQYDQEGNIVVHIAPLPEEMPLRTLYLSLECGDAFKDISLEQKRK